jgi:heat shock protein HspQ
MIPIASAGGERNASWCEEPQQVAIGKARFGVGQVVHHKMYNYRGVIFDVDPVFLGTEEWYDQVALSRPPKDKPWYHVLVHTATHTTYVAERNLEADDSGEGVRHPLLEDYFADFRDGRYIPRVTGN